MSYSQNGKNIRNFEHRKWHFGVMLGANSTGYDYQLNPDFINKDSVFNVSITKRPGFGIHVPLISFNLHATTHIRFNPSISFHETLFSYSQYKNGKPRTRETTVEPTNLNFPLTLKLSTKRITNFSAYARGGFGYSLDLATQEEVAQSVIDPIVKLKRHDMQYHVGGGFDFYLPYFKLGIDINYTRGIRDILIHDDTFYSSPLAYLRSSIWWFSLTFEG